MLEDFVNKGSESFDLRIIEVEDELGTKPKYLEQQFDDPSLWGAIGDLTDIVYGLDEGSNLEQEESTFLDCSSKKRNIT